MKDHPSLVELPRAYSVMLPILEELDPPDENRTTCATCPQAVVPEAPDDPDRRFLHDVRCCTYQPRMPNYLLGRALARGGVGAERIRARIRREPEGIHILGIHGTRALAARYSNDAFGRDRELTCPFWVPGPLSCSIWRDRNTVCRTWFCRSTDAGRSVAYWDTLRDALAALEVRIAQWIGTVAMETELPEDGADVETWVAWYIGCHERLERASDAELLAIPFEERDGVSLALQVYQGMLFSPLPDVVLPNIAEIEQRGSDLALGGYSRLDKVVVKRSFMALYGLLVEGVPWREALERASQMGAVYSPEFVELLWRRGLLTWVPGEEPQEVLVYREIAKKAGFSIDEDAEVEPPPLG